MKDLYLILPALLIVIVVLYAFRTHHIQHNEYVNFLKQQQENETEKTNQKPTRTRTKKENILPRERQSSIAAIIPKSKRTK